MCTQSTLRAAGAMCMQATERLHGAKTITLLFMTDGATINAPWLCKVNLIWFPNIPSTVGKVGGVGKHHKPPKTSSHCSESRSLRAVFCRTFFR